MKQEQLNELLGNLYQCMESTTWMNRGEVDSFEGVLSELSLHFGTKKLRRFMPFIQKYYRYMVLVELLDFQEWRIERGNQTWYGKIGGTYETKNEKSLLRE